MHKSITRRSALAHLSTLGLACSARAAWGQAKWPSRPVRFITQSAPGDPVDLRLREFTQGLQPLLGGVNSIIDNKTGAGGILAHQALLQAPADGHTFLLANAAMTIFPSIYRKLPYSPLRDFMPIAFSGFSPIGLAVAASSPERTLAEWAASAARQSQKGRLNYGSPGNGSVSHVYGFQVNEDFGLGATHIPYKGASPALMDLASGQVHFMMLDIFSLRPLLAQGALRLLAVSGDRRSKYLPEVPTFAELGHRGYDRTGWTGYYARAGTPAAVAEQMATAMNQLNAAPEWVEKRGQVWSDWLPLKPAEMAERVKAETEAYARLVAKIGFYAD
jgi:tripartite-type tricarboxylate transporter receptor subunit TctC